MMVSRCHKADVYIQECNCGDYYVCMSCMKPCVTIFSLQLIIDENTQEENHAQV